MKQNVHLCDNPLIQHRLSILRDKHTGSAEFRRNLIECGSLMAYEIAATFPTTPYEVETPLERAAGLQISVSITLVAILRAALGFVDGLSTYLPQARIGHIGLYRNEKTLEPVQYYIKLPSNLSEDRVILADPMLATGGSLLAGLDLLLEKGCSATNIVIASLLAAPEGIRHVHSYYPDIPIFTAAIDRQLNEHGYILPGLGDAGDRQYGTY